MPLLISRSLRESLRTNLWVIPSSMVAMIVVLFVVTTGLDREAAAGRLILPTWVRSGSADAVRQMLIAIAAAVITVAGVVFSITILVLQLASQQFGPRMLRSFIRDRGTQFGEVAIRALSPAVNDTFTALNCIDWLGDCLCRACREDLPSGIYHDATGNIRLIEPAVLIRQLQNLERVMGAAETPGQRESILHHANVILRASEESVVEESDQRDVQAAYDSLLALTREIWKG